MKAWPASRRSVQLLLCLASVLLASHSLAQEAKVRTSLETKGAIWVGQKVTVVVELLAPGYFSSAVTFDLPDPQGVLLMPPMGRPIMSSETVDGTSYTVQRHELSAYPMRAGDQSVPSFSVRFSFKRAPMDTNEIAAAVKTNSMPFTVKMPPGAENLGQVISARDLKIEETWQPEPGKENVIAGAAFTRTVTFTAPDVPGMVFPPFPAGQIDGLGIYTKRQLLDQTDGGSLRGERRDLITYICKRPGEFTIPAVRFIWFDLETKQLRTNDLAQQTLKVGANPALATASGTDSERVAAALRSIAWWKLMGLAVAALALILAGWSVRFRRVLADWFAPFRPLHLQALNPTERSLNGYHAFWSRKDHPRNIGRVGLG
jgi:hypothetical protein